MMQNITLETTSSIDEEINRLQLELNKIVNDIQAKRINKQIILQQIQEAVQYSKSRAALPSYQEIFFAPANTNQHLQEFFGINEILTSFVLDLIEKPVKNHLATGRILASIIKTIIGLKDIANVNKSLPTVIGMILIAVSAVLMLFPVIYVRRTETNVVLRLLNIATTVLNIARAGINSSTFYTIRVGLQIIKGLLTFLKNTIDSWILQNVFAVIIAFTLLPVAVIVLYYLGVVFTLIGGVKDKINDFLRNADIFASAVRRYVLALGVAATAAIGVAWFARQSNFLRNILHHVENGFKQFINEFKMKRQNQAAATNEQTNPTPEQKANTSTAKESPTQALTNEADYLTEVDFKQILQGVIGAALITFIFKLLKKLKVAAILGFLIILAMKYEKFRNWVQRIPMAHRIIQLLIAAYKQFVKRIGLDKILQIGEQETKNALSQT